MELPSQGRRQPGPQVATRCFKAHWGPSSLQLPDYGFNVSQNRSLSGGCGVSKGQVLSWVPNFRCNQSRPEWRLHAHRFCIIWLSIQLRTTDQVPTWNSATMSLCRLGKPFQSLGLSFLILQMGIRPPFCWCVCVWEGGGGKWLHPGRDCRPQAHCTGSGQIAQ